MEERFLNKTIIFTGGCSGIGGGCVRRLAAEGANVVLTARGRDRLDEVAAELNRSRTMMVQTDVSDEAQMALLIEKTIARFGQIDVLVSNAGMAIVIFQ